MRIEKIPSNPDRSGRYSVRFGDGSVLRLYRQTLEDFSLYVGKELTQETYMRLQDAAGQMSAKMRAVRIVTASSVSKADLRQRLIQKGETQADADNAVQWMSDLSLLDDEATAKTVVSQCIRKGYGPARAKQALYEKRIPKSLWEEALADYPDQTEYILRFLQSKLSDQPDEKQIRKAVDALMRRGHDYGTIRRVLNGYLQDAQAFLEE